MKFQAALATSSMLLVIASSAGAAEQAPQSGRVLIFDIQTEGVSGPEVGQLPDLIGQLVAKHPGFTAVPDAEMHRALGERKQEEPACVRNDACRRAIAEKLHADLVVSGTVAKIRKSISLDLALARTEGTPPAIRVTTRLRTLNALPDALKTSLKELFQWSDVAEQPIRTEPIPPLKPTPDQGPGAPPPSSVAAPAQPDPVAPPSLAPHLPQRSGSPERKSMALVAVTRGEGFSEREANTVEELLLSALDSTGKFRLIGRTDINALLTLEARKQATGCADDAGCVAEIAGALGVDLVATADVGYVGKTEVVTLKVIDVRSATVVARAQEIIPSREAVIIAARSIAVQVVRALWPGLNFTLPGVKLPPPHWVRPLAWSGVGVGGAMLLVATLLEISVGVETNQLKSTRRPLDQQEARISSINAQLMSADALFAAGAVFSATGVGLVVAF